MPEFPVEVQSWTARYDGPYEGADDAPRAMVLSPDGSTIFVTGEGTRGSDYLSDYATVAYDADTGARLWSARFGEAGYEEQAHDIAISPDGSTVFVTGENWSHDPFIAFTTVAYDAANGTERWVASYGGPLGGYAIARALAVDPDGTKVYVTGHGVWRPDADIVTIAYDVADGGEVWRKRSTDAATQDQGEAIAVGPGGRVYVTGVREVYGEAASNSDIVIHAFDGAMGDPLWSATYGVGAAARPAAATLVPDGSMLVVAGEVGDADGNTDYVTAAFSALTGERHWASRYDGPARGIDRARDLAVASDGRTVFVTGYSEGAGTGFDYATLAYSIADGGSLWLSRETDAGNGDDYAEAITASPDGSRVFVTGVRAPGLLLGFQGIGTVSYDAGRGSRRWAARLKGAGHGRAIAVHPGGEHLYVTGDDWSTGYEDFITASYCSDLPLGAGGCREHPLP